MKLYSFTDKLWWKIITVKLADTLAEKEKSDPLATVANHIYKLSAAPSVQNRKITVLQLRFTIYNYNYIYS
jgi:hypothetical protein